MLAEHREPVGHLGPPDDRGVVPEGFDQASGLVDPTLLSQEDQDQVPQGRDLRARTPQGRDQDPLGFGDPSQRDHGLRVLQGRPRGPGRIRRDAIPGRDRRLQPPATGLATPEPIGDLGVIRALLRQPGEPFPRE